MLMELLNTTLIPIILVSGLLVCTIFVLYILWEKYEVTENDALRSEYNKQWIAQARVAYEYNPDTVGEIEIHDNAKITETGTDTIWVQAWVMVEREEGPYLASKRNNVIYSVRRSGGTVTSDKTADRGTK